MCIIRTHPWQFKQSTIHDATGWRRPIGCLQLQVIFSKRATNCKALCRKWPVKMRHPMGLCHPVPVRLCLCLCVFACFCVCLCLCLRLCFYACVWLNVCLCLYLCLFVCLFVRVRAATGVCVCVQTYASYTNNLFNSSLTNYSTKTILSEKDQETLNDIEQVLVHRYNRHSSFILVYTHTWRLESLRRMRACMLPSACAVVNSSMYASDIFMLMNIHISQKNHAEIRKPLMKYFSRCIANSTNYIRLLMTVCMMCVYVCICVWYVCWVGYQDHKQYSAELAAYF